MVEYILPGFYTSYTIEVDIGLLIFNTICKSEELKNIDKEASFLIDSKFIFFTLLIFHK